MLDGRMPRRNMRLGQLAQSLRGITGTSKGWSWELELRQLCQGLVLDLLQMCLADWQWADEMPTYRNDPATADAVRSDHEVWVHLM